MFWVHDKFGNELDDLDGPGWPDYSIGLVRLDNPNRLDQPRNLDRLGRPGDPDKPDDSYRSVVPVKFVNLAQPVWVIGPTWPY